MPQLELMDRYQDAVLWEPAGTDAYGEAKFTTPQSIKVRWNVKKTMGYTDQVEPTESRTYDAMVISDRELKKESVLWLGTLSDWTTASASTDPAAYSGLHQVKDVMTTKDIKGRNTRYESKLVRYKGVLNT